ncbi:hypothetical protein P8452_27028 [Trifolium repens]|nr:hypothetical protein P8452_27028 [Trifolium repens]
MEMASSVKYEEGKATSLGFDMQTVGNIAMIHTDHQYWRISMSYPDATDEDVRRYERSFTNLPPAHKALLSHYPLKVQRLRRYIVLLVITIL